MKKLQAVLLLSLILASGSLLADSPWITLDFIGLHGSGGTSDYSAVPGEQIYISAQYDTDSDYPAMDNVTGPYYTTTNLNKVVVYWYNGADPNTSTYLSSGNATVSSIAQGGTGTDVAFSCNFTLPTAPTGAQSFQVMFGLYGDDEDFTTEYGTRYTSYITRSSYSPPAGSPAAGWQKYMAYAADTTTQTPTLTYPGNNTRDNSSIAVRFTLPEAAYSGTVKLYIDNNSTFGDDNETTLTLTSSYLSAGTYSFTLTGSDLSSSSAVASYTGSNSLTNGNTYYWYIGYQDASQNAEARGGPNAQMYDTAALAVQSISGSDNGDGTVDVGYTLQENADDLWIIFYDNSLSATRARVQVDETYDSAYLTGAARSIPDIDATNFANNTGLISAVDGTYAASLVDGHTYAVKIEYTDMAGNTTTTTGASTFTYSNDTTTGTPTSPSAVEGYNSTDDAAALTCGYTLPEDGSIVDIIIDNDATHPAAGSAVAGVNVQCIISIYDQLDEGTHSFILSVPFTASDNGGDGDNVTSVDGSGTLVHGTTYYYAVRYKDAAGNAYARTNWINFTWDGTTAAFASFTAPNDIYFKSGDVIPVTYTLGETGRDGSIKINVYKHDSGTLYTTCTLASGQNLNNTSAHTISLNPASLSSSTGVASADPYNNLSDISDAPEDYWFEVVYRDQYGNAQVATAAKRHVYYDDATIAATLTQPVSGGSTSTVNIPIDYTLGEGMTSLYIDFIGQGTITLASENEVQRLDQQVNSRLSMGEDVTEEIQRDATTHTIQLTGSYLTSGNHSFTLTGNDLGMSADDDITLTSGTNTLTAEEQYNVRIRVIDTAGNTSQATTNTNYAYLDDVTTETPTITAPSAGSYKNDTITFSFTLPEPGTAGSIKILFDTDTDHGTVYETMTFVDDQSSGAHSVTLENMSTDIAGNAEISASSPHNALADASGQPQMYYIAVQYQDDQGNPAATSAWHTFYFDTQTLAITLDFPTDSQVITGNFDVQYDLQEDALAGNTGLYLKFACTSTTETDRTFAISSHTAGSNIVISSIDPDDIDAHASLTLLTGSTALTLGETYTVSIHTRDLANNTEKSDSSTGVTYSTALSVLTIANVQLADEPLDGPSSTDQQLLRFSLAANSGQTVDVSQLSFALTGTGYVSSDFANASFELWQDTDNNGTPDVSIWSGISYASPLVLSGGAFTVTPTATYYIVLCDLSATANETHTIRLTLNQSGVTSDADSYAGFPIQGRTHYLDGTITEIAGGGMGSGLISAGTEGAVLYWYLTCNQGTSAYSSVTVGMTVDDWNDFDEVKLYKNSSASLTGATLLDTETSPSGTSVTFTPSTNVTTTRQYFIVSVVVAAGAGNNTVSANIEQSSDMVFAAPYAYLTSLDLDAVFPIQGDIHNLPVELSSFNISNKERVVTLAWTTQTETENAGFNLYRGTTVDAMTSGQYIKLNSDLIPGANYSTIPVNYSFTDEYRVDYNTTYYYWLETQNMSGTSDLFAPVAYTPVKDGDNPAPGYVQYGLHQNYPNPFNPVTTISFIMKDDGRATLNVYNVKGQLVRQLFNDNATAGQKYEIIWNGDDESGRGVASGIYFYRINQGSTTETKQMILLR